MILEQNGSYNIGEMAHVIARKPGGPRGKANGGADDYANLILLCPTCHTRIDKAPEGEFPESMLHRWKREHENLIRSAGRDRLFKSFNELKVFVKPLLLENRALWRTFGPKSKAAQSDPGSNLHMVWTLRKLDRIIPNNTRITNVIEANQELLDESALQAFIDFKLHAGAFEANQYDRLDSYPTFPESFSEIFIS
ncbi:MAG: hypothetical protein QOE77_1943 [Blastocatellia bacterium]|nr:hypothetical protein [Blastocatellia bacterium]